ncbi:MAG TPA: hypothetical protein PLX97_02010 [Gemmatales bacterium]|nr:hypothetical protein [Gemmatales bacterium]
MRWWYLGLLIVIIPVAGYLQNQIRGERELARVLALWDAEGRWRWREVIADRPAVADAENLSILITQMASTLKTSGMYLDPEMQLFESIMQHPQHLLTTEQITVLQRRRKDAASFFEKLPRFRAMSGASRLQFQIKNNPWDTYVPIQEHRETFNRFLDQFRLELTQGNQANALALMEDQIKVSRSLTHEPNLICYLVYLATESIAAQNVQHWLALSEPDDASLQKMQQYFTVSEDNKHWRYVILSESGGLYDMLRCLQNDPSMLSKITPSPSGEWWSDPFNHFKYSVAKLQLNSPRQTAAMMQWLFDGYQQAEKPYAEQMAFLKQHVEKLQQEKSYLPFTAKNLMSPAWQKVLQIRMRLAAQMRCVQIALAAERFRLANQRWPSSQEELVGKYLPKLLTDPYDDKPLRYKLLPDGVVIYSIGAQIPSIEKDDDGDVLMHEDGSYPKDTGIRLWNVEQRRQPARPKPKEEKAVELTVPVEEK